VDVPLSGACQSAVDAVASGNSRSPVQSQRAYLLDNTRMSVEAVQRPWNSAAVIIVTTSIAQVAGSGSWRR
jgi:hypothetical protein